MASMTIEARDLRDEDIIRYERAGLVDDVMVWNVKVEGDRVRFSWANEAETQHGTLSVRASRTFTWWGR